MGGRNFALKVPQIAEAVDLYAKGLSMMRIADAFGVSSGAVRSALKLSGVKIRNRIEQHRIDNRLTLESIRMRCIVDANECWLWQGSMHRSGYGWLRTNGRSQYVHRVTYELANGPIPKGKQLHKDCGRKRCCNPEHMTAGAHKQVMRMASEAGRLSNGFLHRLAVKRSWERRRQHDAVDGQAGV